MSHTKLSEGDVGAEMAPCGVSGRGGPGARRKEWLEAREEGRDIARRVGVRNKKGTPAASSL